MEASCHKTFNELNLSRLYATSKTQLYIVRGPLLVVKVALQWLGDHVTRQVAEIRSEGTLSMLHPKYMIA